MGAFAASSGLGGWMQTGIIYVLLKVSGQTSLILRILTLTSQVALSLLSLLELISH